VTREHPV